MPALHDEAESRIQQGVRSTLRRQGEHRQAAPVEGQIDVQLTTALADLQVSPTPKATNLGASTDSTKDDTLGVQELPLPTMAEEVTSLICSYPWPQGCDYWIAVAFCESSLSPNAIGYMGSYVGLFQVWLGHGYSGQWLLDPSNNVLATWELSHEGTRTNPWPYCQ